MPDVAARTDLPAGPGRLQGKAAIITGGEGSIGMATARAFAAEGARVRLVGLIEDELDSGASALGGAGSWSVADVTDASQVKAAIDSAAADFGRLDVVISNAGIAGVNAPVAEYPEDVFDQVLAVHVRGSFLVCKYAMPHLRRGASIVITSSVVGLTSGPGICAYATAKHGLVGLMRTLAKEGAPHDPAGPACPARGGRPRDALPGESGKLLHHRDHAGR
jgi:NAD(P)-dependent dehydrogenase (short-subunit alcohol dehydrogenase family)